MILKFESNGSLFKIVLVGDSWCWKIKYTF
ncbi:unnamed protein product [Coffea canephora]|uniref:DH200=94 genomic scaffold, scaffold_810 n=1 Tax=Coffea canephora TaxID=49390 RepID=A0A068VHA7_COFCA|nr:unnamed protein product [Coffea canephora]